LTIALQIAILNDQTDAALILLYNGVPLNQKYCTFYDGSKPLLNALQKQNKAVVDRILEADVIVGDTPGTASFLEAAAMWGDIPVIEDLIFMGADINAGRQATALAAAVTSKNRVLVELLLKHGASPNICAYSGLSPLEAAVNNKDDDMIQLLISNDADPACGNALHSAIENYQQAFGILLETFCARYPRGKKGFGGSLIINAIEKQEDELLSAMLSAKFDINSFFEQRPTGLILLTALGFAITYKKGRDINLVQRLIDNNAGGDLNSIARKSSYGYLNKARFEETALMVAIATRSKEMVELLLKNGANIYQPARRGLKLTLLQQACNIGSFNMAKLLLENGAIVNEEPADRGGATALQLAASSGSVKIAKLLLSHGALIHASPAKMGGWTAFEGAARHGSLEMISVLWD